MLKLAGQVNRGSPERWGRSVRRPRIEPDLGEGLGGRWRVVTGRVRAGLPVLHGCIDEVEDVAAHIPLLPVGRGYGTKGGSAGAGLDTVAHATGNC